MNPFQCIELVFALYFRKKKKPKKTPEEILMGIVILPRSAKISKALKATNGYKLFSKQP